jgi:uncharacterized protein (DUF924 family)
VTLNDPQILGHVMRAIVALGTMLFAAGLAARLCRTRTAWAIAAGGFLLLFLWLQLAVEPHPHQAGLLYSVEWGVFGAAAYAVVRAVRAPDPTREPLDPETLLSFWFGPDLASAEAVEARSALWFSQDDDFDRAIAERFGDWPDRARDEDLQAWESTPRGALALVIVLDQIPRNLHRRRAEAFAYDDAARRVATTALERGYDDLLHPIEAAFLYLPLEHAEDPALQARCVERFTRLRDRCPEALAPTIDRYLDYARRHHAVIQRFGRFPHRNETLGRESTPDEIEWLADGGDRFGG